MNKYLVMNALIEALLCVSMFYEDDDINNCLEATSTMEHWLRIAYDELKRNAISKDDEIALLYKKAYFAFEDMIIENGELTNLPLHW